MRLRVLFTTVVVALACAAAATAAERPVRRADGPLLRRAPTYEERIAEGVARTLTRRSASVRCGSLGVSDPSVLGITLFVGSRPAGYFLMRPALCHELSWFHDSPGRYDPRGCATASCLQDVANAALALATVSHESYHLLGYRNEARVECYGMQSIWYVANKLGASLHESQALATFYWTRLYPNRRTQTPLYWSSDCRDGGRLDLRPSSASWPS